MLCYGAQTRVKLIQLQAGMELISEDLARDHYDRHSVVGAGGTVCKSSILAFDAGTWSPQGRHLRREEGCKMGENKDKLEP